MATETNLDSPPRILLTDIWPIENVKDYKVHFARWNGSDQPLDEWVKDRSIWTGWQEFRPTRNEFSRRYIFSLMNFYPDGVQTWLFGGIFRVLRRHADRYEVELTDYGRQFIGRLKLWSAYTNRATRVNFENHYVRESTPKRYPMTVAEILREPFSGRAFPGYEKIDLSFSELEVLARNDRPDWKTALEHVKGVYLITDSSARTRRHYVGSAYGDDGLWARWKSYIDTVHGGNVELRALVSEKGDAHCRAHFRFALLEYLPAYALDETVLGREAHWKQVLMSREFGLNQN
ncbi:MAG: GIY-YIG nuclease family protein [Chloroflexota bacterium]|nr:GIY-YIG nuclease family protein [Chloroflexota bacterium]